MPTEAEVAAAPPAPSVLHERPVSAPKQPAAQKTAKSLPMGPPKEVPASGGTVVQVNVGTSNSQQTQMPPVYARVNKGQMDVSCPHCSTPLQVEARHAGKHTQCPSCEGMFAIPMPAAAMDTAHAQAQRPPHTPPENPFAAGSVQEKPAMVARPYPPTGIFAPILVSGISNIAVAGVYVLTCWLAFLAIPLIILAIFELVCVGTMKQVHPRALAGKARLLGIFEIVVGLFNWVSLVCGIIVLVNANQLSVNQTRGA